MSVWDTFSASLHMVQEKLEQVLEDTPTEQEEEEVGMGKVGLRDGVCVESVCGECVCVYMCMYALRRRRRQWERGRLDWGMECVCVCVWRVCVYMCMH